MIREKINQVGTLAQIPTFEDKIKHILNFAVLAPSTHNSQPWLFKIENNLCKIYYDSNINIKHADPERRDLFISMGCCIENLIIAGRYFNIFQDINYICKNDCVAEIFFENKNNSYIDLQWKYLLDSISRRQNTRGIFKKEKIPEQITQPLRGLCKTQNIKIHLFEQKSDIQKIASLTGEGMEKAHKSKEFRHEMSHWIHHNYTKHKKGMPGYALGVPTPLSFILPHAVKHLNLGRMLKKLNQMTLSSAPLAIVISSDDNTETTWVKVGQIAERLMLELCDKNIHSSVYMAAIEIGGLYKKLQRDLNIAERPQFLCVAGYKNPGKKFTPRKNIEEKIL